MTNPQHSKVTKKLFGILLILLGLAPIIIFAFVTESFSELAFIIVFMSFMFLIGLSLAAGISYLMDK